MNTHNLATGMLAQSASGQALVVGSGDGTVKAITVAKLLEPDVFWHNSHVRDVKFLAGGRKIVSASGNGAIYVWDLNEGTKSEIAKADERELFAVGCQTNIDLVTSVSASRSVALYNIKTKEMVRQFEVDQRGIRAAAFTRSGQQLGVATREGVVAVYQDQDSESVLFPDDDAFATSQHEAKVNALAFSDDENLLAIAFDDHRVMIVDARTGAEEYAPLQLSNTPLSLTFCESDQLLAIGTQAGEIHLWQPDTQQVRQIIKAHSSRVNALAAFADGRTIVSGGRDKELRLWDTATGELLTSLAGHGRQIFCIAVSHDGTTIASGGLAGDVRIWRGPR